MSSVEFSEVCERESTDGDHEQGEDAEKDEIEAPRLVPLQLQEDFEDRVDQETLFSVQRTKSNFNFTERSKVREKGRKEKAKKSRIITRK